MKVLAIIDMQKDFIDGALGTKEAVSIVPKVAARLKKAREDGEMVVFTRDTHHADYLSTQEGRNLPVPHCMEGTADWQIDAALPVLDAPVCVVLTLIFRIFTKTYFLSPWVVYFSILSTHTLVKYARLKRKTDLILAILYLAMCLTFFAFFILRLVEVKE